MNNMILSLNAWIQFILPMALVLLFIKPLGTYLARVYSNQFVFLEHVLGPIEVLFYKVAKIDPLKEMGWKEYAMALLMASAGCFVVLFGILSYQHRLPLNPQQFPDLRPELAFNIAASFITNTDWQSYSGETTLSYFSQMVGLGVQNFLSASMGICVFIALARGFIRKNTHFLGNFWADWLRGSLYVLLPLAIMWAVLFGSQGVIQNFKPYFTISTLDGSATQTIPGGPVASQAAIKQLGSNGGGFFNTNAAHPFENPTPLSNLFGLIGILLIPAALCYTFGLMINDKRQGWMILITMTLIFLPLTFLCMKREQIGNEQFFSMPISQTQSDIPPIQSGGNMEGKELRFGIISSALWSGMATATGNGSMNSMLDAYAPYASMIPMIFIMLGEIVFGGVGSGLYNMLIYILITVFIAGLMVGRTPEYLGKKIETFDIKMASLCILLPIALVLFGTAFAVMHPAGKAGIYNSGAQGFSEILYAILSCTLNNGSSFAGFHAELPFYQLLLGIMMLTGRFWIMIFILAIAGSLAQKNVMPATAGTLQTHSPLFIGLLLAIIFLNGLLTYIPALTIGPVNEHFYMMHLK